MGFRIDHNAQGPGTVLHIAGRLSGRAVVQLERACDPIDKPIVINLKSLVFADDEGIKAIQNLVDHGAQVQGASPFVRLLLDIAPSSGKGL